MQASVSGLTYISTYISGNLSVLYHRVLLQPRCSHLSPSPIPHLDGAWKEEQVVRHIEPALAFRLDLSRLPNYQLTPCFLASRYHPR